MPGDPSVTEGLCPCGHLPVGQFYGHVFCSWEDVSQCNVSAIFQEPVSHVFVVLFPLYLHFIVF